MTDVETKILPGPSLLQFIPHSLLRQFYDLGVLKIVYHPGRPPTYEILNEKIPED